MKTAVIILVIFSVLGCQPKSDKIKNNSAFTIDNTFQFTIKDATDFIDSKMGSLTRQYMDGTKTVHFEITQQELVEIQSIYFQNKLDSLPDFYTPNCKPNIVPNFDEEYVIYFKGQQKKIIYNSDYECLDSNSEKIVKKIEIFRSAIFEKLNKKTEVEQLEISDVIFI